MRVSYVVNAIAGLMAFGLVVEGADSVRAQSVSGVPFWSVPTYDAYDAVVFPFAFTWPHHRRQDPEIVYLRGNEGDAVTYRIPVTDNAYALCMRVSEANYSRVFQSGDFACFFDGYQFTSAQAMNAYITYRRPGERIVAHGYRRTRNGYEPIQETFVLQRIPPFGDE